MSAILVEVVLFVALVGLVAALAYWVTLTFTPLGRRIRETRNREAIDMEAELTCPVHGRVPDGELVRLTSGERMCPACYRDAVQGRIE